MRNVDKSPFFTSETSSGLLYGTRLLRYESLDRHLNCLKNFCLIYVAFFDIGGVLKDKLSNTCLFYDSTK